MVEPLTPMSPNTIMVGITQEGNVGLTINDHVNEASVSLVLPPHEGVNLAVKFIQAAYMAQLRRILGESPVSPETMNSILQTFGHGLDNTLEIPAHDDHGRPLEK